mmetsp:Transcript_11691/g.26290  ORF Transcript_11691/g.26290 Transcript_11691/m.26290 type:complete len:123 (-) Transcript_11691:442-810(-)
MGNMGNMGNMGTDHRLYAFGHLEPDLHPLSSLPCLCPHICALQEAMGLLDASDSGVGVGVAAHQSQSQQPQQQRQTQQQQQYNHPSQQSHRLWLLRWLALLGPCVGIRLSPQAFVQVQALLE